MKKLVTAIAFSFLLLLPCINLYAETVVISTLEGENPAMIIVERVMKEAYERIGMKMELKKYPSRRSIMTANRGQVDGELIRIKQIGSDYPNLIPVPVEIMCIDFVVFTKDKQFNVKGWESILPYSVDYLGGTLVIEKNLIDGTDVTSVKALEHAFRRLDIGWTDVVVDGRFSGQLIAKKLGLSSIKVLEPPLISVSGYHYVNAKNKSMVEPLITVLQKMKAEGRINEIKEQVTREFLNNKK